jgi:hypothetical protein
MKLFRWIFELRDKDSFFALRLRLKFLVCGIRYLKTKSEIAVGREMVPGIFQEKIFEVIQKIIWQIEI